MLKDLPAHAALLWHGQAHWLLSEPVSFTNPGLPLHNKNRPSQDYWHESSVYTQCNLSMILCALCNTAWNRALCQWAQCTHRAHLNQFCPNVNFLVPCGIAEVCLLGTWRLDHSQPKALCSALDPWVISVCQSLATRGWGKLTFSAQLH